jgi:hypothetical protein
MSHHVFNSPARVNRTMRGGDLISASARPPPKRRQSQASALPPSANTAPRSWYGDPVVIAGGRHPNAIAGNEDEVNRNVQLYDALPTKFLLDSVVGIATRLRDSVAPIEFARDYGQPAPDRDFRILQDGQRVLNLFNWPVTDAINHLLAAEYVIHGRFYNNRADIRAIEEHQAARSQRSAAPVVANVAPSASGDRKRRRG